MQTLTREDLDLSLERFPSKLYPPGRRCERFDCITILCRFNPGPTCFIHTTDEFRPRRAAA